MAKLDFEELYLLGPVLDGVPLESIPDYPGSMSLPMRIRIDYHFTYWDEFQNVWYEIFVGLVFMGPIWGIAAEKEYPMSIFVLKDR